MKIKWPWTRSEQDSQQIKAGLKTLCEQIIVLHTHVTERASRIEAKQAAMHEAVKQLVAAQWEANNAASKARVEQQQLHERMTSNIEDSLAALHMRLGAATTHTSGKTKKRSAKK